MWKIVQYKHYTTDYKKTKKPTNQQTKILHLLKQKQNKTTRYQCMLNNMLKGFLKSSKSVVFKCNFFLYF